jgi:hypothetical protein
MSPDPSPDPEFQIPERTAKRYVAVIENKHGETLVYVHQRNRKPVPYHSDYSYLPLVAEIHRLTDMRPPSLIVGERPILDDEGLPVADQEGRHQMIVSEEEALWVAACREMSYANLKRSGGKQPDGLTRDALTALGFTPTLGLMLR